MAVIQLPLFGCMPALPERSDLVDSAPAANGDFDLVFACKTPYDFDSLLAFFKMRAVPGVERVAQSAYARTLRILREDVVVSGWLDVCFDVQTQHLCARVAAGLLPARELIVSGVRRQFDVDCDPIAVARVLGPFADRYPGLRLPGAMDAFEQALRAILGQQISVLAATTLAGRIAAQFGTPIETPFPETRSAIPQR